MRKKSTTAINSTCVLCMESVSWKYLERESGLKSHPMQKFPVKHPGQMVILSVYTYQQPGNRLEGSSFTVEVSVFSKLFLSGGMCVLVTS